MSSALNKTLLIAIALLAALAGPAASSAERRAHERNLETEPTWTILLVGGSEDNRIRISLSLDGRSYEIDSKAVLEAPENVCAHPPGAPTQLACEATRVAGFEVNAGDGDDDIVLHQVPVPATLRGGAGDDRLLGSTKADKLIGGSGDDALIGRGGDDAMFGGPGSDRLFGRGGADTLRGGPGKDRIVPGSGRDDFLDRD